MTEAARDPSRRAVRRERFGPDAAERISAGCYGALVAASTLIGLTEVALGSLALVAVLTNIVYFATHVFAHTISSPPDSEGRGWSSARHHIAVSAPMVSVAFAPIVLVVLLDLVGISRESAVMVGVAAALAYLVTVATVGAHLRGLRAVTVVAVGVVTTFLAVALVIAKISLH